MVPIHTCVESESFFHLQKIRYLVNSIPFCSEDDRHHHHSKQQSQGKKKLGNNSGYELEARRPTYLKDTFIAIGDSTTQVNIASYY